MLHVDDFKTGTTSAEATVSAGLPVGALLASAPPALSSSTAPAPRSRSERLREYYANRSAHSEKASEVAASGESQVFDQALALRKRGNDVYEAQDYEGAVELYSEAIRIAPTSVLHSNRAAAYMMLGWWEQALRDTKAAIRRDENNLKALERQGKILVALDRCDEACQNIDVLENSSAAMTQQSKSTPQRLRWLVEHARSPNTLQDVRNVLSKFGSKAELASPLGMRLRRQLLQMLLEKSDAVDNERKCKPKPHRSAGLCDNLIEEIAPFAEEALQVTAELLEDLPEDADLRYWRGRALIRLGKRDDAEAQLLRCLKEQPEHLQARELLQTMESLENYKIRGNTAYRDGRLHDAIQFYSVAIERDLNCVDVRTVATLHYNRAAVNRNLGEFEKALEDVNISLALNPKWTKALYRRGVLLLECGRAAEALTELKSVQRCDPTFDDALEDWIRRAHNWLAKPKGEKNYYQIMQIPMDASSEDVRRQYKRLCLMWHPDKSPTEEAVNRFDMIQEAYRFLLNDTQRESYDFGIWKNKQVRHHTKRRERVKDVCVSDDDEEPVDRQLLEDDKVESIWWGEKGCPDWLRQRREEVARQRLGGYSDKPRN